MATIYRRASVASELRYAYQNCLSRKLLLVVHFMSYKDNACLGGIIVLYAAWALNCVKRTF